jgi:hypothetical protein
VIRGRLVFFGEPDANITPDSAKQSTRKSAVIEVGKVLGKRRMPANFIVGRSI